MPSVELRFYEELNDYLPPGRRKRTFTRELAQRHTVREIIASEGVPVDAVELVLADGRSVDLDYAPAEGERLAIYPVFESIDLDGIRRIHSRPLRRPRFVADAHLGKLAAYLRMVGFDTQFRNDFRDDELERISNEEHRILLSRDRGLLGRPEVLRGYFVKNTHPAEQLEEVLERFELYGLMRPLSRCMRCNAPLEPVDRSEVTAKVPADTLRRHGYFWRCTGCGRIYWKGTHYARMRRRIAALRRRWARYNGAS